MFGYADAVIDRFPTIRAGVIHATNLSTALVHRPCSRPTVPNNATSPNG